MAPTQVCPRCGHENPSDARFCGFCGAALAATAPAGAVAPVVAPLAPAYAGFWIRLVAWLIDMVILQVAMTILSLFISPLALLGAGLTGAFVAFGVNAIVSLALPAVYFVLLTGLRGQTLGKMLLRIQVVDEHGRVPGLGRAILREALGKFVSSIALFIGFLWVAWDKEKQGWHDKIAGTHVIPVKKV